MSSKPLITRHAENPIITAEQCLEGAVCVFNCGATVMDDQIVMLLNLWDSQWRPRFQTARSQDGVHFEISPDNLVSPPKEYPYVPHEGIFDTRITHLEGTYYITYNVGSSLGGRIMLARTDDFKAVETLGFISAPDHRNCVIFPERIGGDYVRLERPNVADSGDIYISYSPDLIHWGRSKLLLARNARYWQSAKVGPGAPPVKTDRGWLVIYHGARQGMTGYSYQAGCMLLDLEDPSQIIGRMNSARLSPTADYELVGMQPNVCFPTAAVEHGHGGELKIYYGAADKCMALATGQTTDIVEACLEGK